MKKIMVISILVAVLGAVAAAGGLFWGGEGQPTAFTNAFGQETMLYGRGLYRHDSISFVAQEKAQDILTLFVAVPVMLLGVFLTLRKTLQGRLLITGMLGYFLYTYTAMAFGAAYNPFFLLYVALFSLSLFGFILAMRQLDLQEINARVSERFPRVAMALMFILVGVFLLVAWVGGRILSPMLAGRPPETLESGITLFIQVLDLGVIVPVAFLTAWLLLRRDAWGVPLAAVIIIKSAALGSAVALMAFSEYSAGVPISMAELFIFSAIALAVLFYTARLFLSIQSPGGEKPA